MPGNGRNNGPFARSDHMVRNKLCWEANNAVGLPKQRNSYQSSPAFLCFGSPTEPYERILQRAFLYDEAYSLQPRLVRGVFSF